MNSKALAQTWPFHRHIDFVRKMRKAATDWFHKKGIILARMPYCLAQWEDWPKNIILPEVAEYIQKQKKQCEFESKPFPLHKYLHHGLSSQAMAFNLIGPLITRKDYKTLHNSLCGIGIKPNFEIGAIEFEYEDRKIFNEDTGQPTSIDIVVKDTTQKPRVFIESKFVEQEFGGCSVFEDGDCNGENPFHSKEKCFLHHIGRRYWSLIEKYGFGETLGAERKCPLVSYYQFYREILFSLENDGIFVLLSDERSPVFHRELNGDKRGLMAFLLSFVPNKLKGNIYSLTVQSVISNIKESGNHKDWIEDFEKKYGLI